AGGSPDFFAVILVEGHNRIVVAAARGDDHQVAFDEGGERNTPVVKATRGILGTRILEDVLLPDDLAIVGGQAKELPAAAETIELAVIVSRRCPWSRSV